MPTRSSRASPMPTMPPQQTLMPASRTCCERVEPILVGARGDDLAVEFGRGVEVVVVVVEAGVLEPQRLLGVSMPSVTQVSRPSAFTPSTMAQTHVEVALLRRAPGGAHAEAAWRRPPWRPCASASTSSTCHQLLAPSSAGVVMRALRAVAAVLRAAAGLDRQERRDLHLARVEMRRWMRWAWNNRSGNGSSNSAAISARVQSWRTAPVRSRAARESRSLGIQAQRGFLARSSMGATMAGA